MDRRQRISPAAAWIVFCAFCTCAGWLLSALHQLNRKGYAAVFLLGAVALVVWKIKTRAPGPAVPSWPGFRRRFARPLPLGFLILAVLAVLGGVLHAPTNYDALAYRLPRVLHWLADDQWHWIHTTFQRLNVRACGVEWVSAPFLALLRTDRLLFAINVVSFLLLPGLVFSVFTRLGVRRRVAWSWMWIVPTGYCFLLQAGGIGNDLFGAPFALAAVDFALRAKTSRAPRDVFCSVLAAALLTGGKLSNLPLLLPCAIALLPSIGLLARRPLRTAMVGIVAVFASFLPMTVLNLHYCGEWSGLKVEGTIAHKDLLIQTGAETVELVLQNLTPPVFPLAGQWNRAVKQALPAGLHERLLQTIEMPAAEFHVDEMQIEEGAGLGFGVSVLLLASVGAAAFGNRRRPAGSPECSLWLTGIRLAPWVSLFALITQANLSTIGRIIAPYYALLIPALLACGAHERIVRRRWWRGLALTAYAMAAGLLIVSPARPLFPVEMFLRKLHQSAEQHPARARIEAVYSVYHLRSDAFAPARAALPPDLAVLGLITGDDPETSLWRPFGSRRIVHVRPEDSAEDLKRRGIEYILVKPEILAQSFHCSLDEWVKRMNGRVAQTIPLALRAARGPTDWPLVKLE